MSDWKEVEVGNTWDVKAAKVNDTVEGLFVGKEEHVGENDSNIYTIETKDGSIGVWGTTVLDTRMKNLKVGEEVRITYLGTVPSPTRKGKSYHSFKVEHRMPEMETVE